MDFSLFETPDFHQKQRKIENKSKKKKKLGTIETKFRKNRRSLSNQSVESLNTNCVSVRNYSNLSPQQLDEINAFKLQKIQEYKDTLEKCLENSKINPPHLSPYVTSKREKLKISNQKADEKRKKILEQKQADEIKRLQKSHSLLIENMYFTISKKKEKTLKTQKIKQKIEKTKIRKEKKIETQQKKQKLIENIKNFYSDKINMLKEQIKEEKSQNDLIKYEQKRFFSSFSKSSK